MTSPRISVVLLLLAGALLLAAGCFGGDIIEEQDIVLYKVTGDGDISWTKNIDSGRDDVVTDLVQAPDGKYIIAGGQSDARCNQYIHHPSTPVLIWLSGSGEILQQRSFDPGTPDGFSALNLRPDGTYLATTNNGSVWTIDQDGKIISVLKINQMQPAPSQKTGPKSPVRCDDESPSCVDTGDSGYVIVEEANESTSGNDPGTRYRAERIGRDGSYLWRRDIMTVHETRVSHPIKIIRTQDGGFLLVFVKEKRSSC